MNATTVAQRSRAKGWRKPEGSVCVTRPGPWGNWWRVTSGERVGWWVTDERYPLTAAFFTTKRSALGAAVAWYRNDLLNAANDDRAQYIRDHVHELRGLTLLCWCDPDGPCHAHVLAEMADA